MSEERTDGTSINPHTVTQDFERELCNYTGAKFAATTNSCTMAILLALAYHIPEQNRYKPPGERPRISLPKPGYISCPQSIVHAGGWPEFRDEDWSGAYQFKPFDVWDSARRFTSGMYIPGQFQCVSFHASKILALEQGGAILHDNEDAQRWFERARFDARTPGVAPKVDASIGSMIGWHCYLNPSTAAQGILRLWSLARDNKDLPNDDYPSLDELEIYKLPDEESND